MSRLARVRLFLVEHTILLGLLVALMVGLVMTSVSIWIYNSSDVSRLDISRPGYEKARESVIKGDETLQFGATGTLDSNAMKDFQQLFDEKREKLDAIGSFEGEIQSDGQLKAAVSE